MFQNNYCFVGGTKYAHEKCLIKMIEYKVNESFYVEDYDDDGFYTCEDDLRCGVCKTE